MRHILSMFLLWAGIPLSAQWSDDFQNSLDTAWSGDREHFIVNHLQQLQLMAPMAGQSSLWRSSQFQNCRVWEVDFFLDFNPSAANRLQIYLASDSAQVDSPNALWIEIGENGNEDSWKLYLRKQKIDSLIASGKKGLFATSIVSGRLSLNRLAPNRFLLWITHPDSGNLMDSMGLHIEESFLMKAKFFGIQCFYTETRKQLFRWDNMNIGTQAIAPKIKAHKLLNPTSIELQWNSVISLEQTANNSTFLLNKLDKADSIHWPNSLTSILHFNTPFLNGNNYQIQYSGVYNLSGSMVDTGSYSFNAFVTWKPQAQDLLISEIMADPSPSLSLPEFEYLEIYNRSLKNLNLKDCIITDGSTESYFPDTIMLPGEYRILCKPEHAMIFQSFGKVIPLEGFPSINNEGESIRIMSGEFDVITEIQFDLNDYGNASKSQGGYSLEWKYLNQPCRGSGGFLASQDLSGGTPGKVNASVDTTGDHNGPKLLKAYATSEWEILLEFDEKIGPSFEFHPERVVLDPLRDVATASPDQQYTHWILLLHQPLVSDVRYTIRSDHFEDCLGNQAEFISNSFQLSTPPDSGDLVFSEILFDAYSYHEEYIEIYNRSEGDVRLDGLEFSMGSPAESWISFKANLKNMILQSKQYVAFSSSPSDVCTTYPHCDSLHVIEMPWPGLDDRGETVLMSYNNGRQRYLLDSVRFDPSWHHPFEHETEGKSLEKLDLEQASFYKANWQTALNTSGYGTPGLPNSHGSPRTNVTKSKPYQLNGNRISPNGDGSEDYLFIQMQPPMAGFLSKIELYSLSGVPIAELFEGRVALQHPVIWNGQDGQGNRLAFGNYILLLNFIHPQGDEMTFKERVSLVP